MATFSSGTEKNIYDQSQYILAHSFKLTLHRDKELGSGGGVEGSGGGMEGSGGGVEGEDGEGEGMRAEERE